MKKMKLVFLSFFLSFMGLGLSLDDAHSRTPIMYKISKEVLNIVLSEKFIEAKNEVNNNYPQNTLGTFHIYHTSAGEEKIEVEVTQYGEYVGKIILNMVSVCFKNFVESYSFSKDPITENSVDTLKINPPFMNILLTDKKFKSFVEEQAWGEFDFSWITWNNVGLDYKVSFVVTKYIHSPGFLSKVEAKQIGKVNTTIHMGSLVDGANYVKIISFEKDED